MPRLNEWETEKIHAQIDQCIAHLEALKTQDYPLGTTQSILVFLYHVSNTVRNFQWLSSYINQDMDLARTQISPIFVKDPKND